MNIATAHKLESEHDQHEQEPAFKPQLPAARPDASRFDPTQGRKIGSDPYDDPTQGSKIGSDPYDDPTRSRLE